MYRLSPQCSWGVQPWSVHVLKLFNIFRSQPGQVKIHPLKYFYKEVGKTRALEPGSGATSKKIRALSP